MNMRYKRLAVRMLTGWFLLAGTTLASASAMDIDLLLPEPPPPAPRPAPDGKPSAPALDINPLPVPSATEPAPAAPAAALDQVLLEKLRSLRFENFSPPPPGAEFAAPATPAAPRPGQPVDQPAGGAPPVRSPAGQVYGGGSPRGVENEVATLAAALADPESELSRAARAALAGPFTPRRLNELVAAATAAARAGGWSLARAMAPEQELTAGALRIVVAPIWLESVEVTGTKWSNPAALRRPYAGLAGDPLRLPALEKAYAAVNRHPFRSVTATLAPGEAPGATKLELEARERRPWNVFAGYETTHSRESGLGRFNAGFTAAAPWRTEDILTAQYSVDSDFGHLDSASAVYRSALPRGHSLTATVLWSRSSSLSGGVIGQDSTDLMARLAYAVPLPDFRGWTHEIEAGLEWRRTDTSSAFYGIPYYDNVIVAAPLSLGWRGRRADKRGAWGLSVDALGGTNLPLADLTRRAYTLQREGAKPDWLALRAEARREWALPLDFRASQRLWGQWSPDRLTDAGKFNLGGGRSVRGYRESEVGGDGGAGWSMELLSPSLARWPAAADGAGGAENGETDRFRRWRPLGLRLAAFYDGGWVYNAAPLPAWEKRTTLLAGAGVGLRLDYRPWASVRADYAWRLHDTGVDADDKTRGYGYLSVNVMF